ncbi:beta-ketoacyl-[acyl-carrier-protein] synthase family protein [Plantibacter sp. CFBP 8775]|uniref:beta-ketoacyl-[acyl-carrier-protein] synthase family protein n=1 Tax=Plantibacter sp. CFBP 8775 TaxID=2774038 RepID=UPI00177D9DE2|nr:beta-ketoacyl-[acyl-carrier-protein] synthase family protein [Plantibacter sp. CFBP 8775]MBD8104614.1 beta-ketoacyl-[acyl-carrier-protein] synthase family protein [Plantibacter sp. CFBP 8775]
MSDRSRRVAITGVGPVTSIGIGATAFREALREGRCGAAPITSFDTTGFAFAHGCEVANPPADDPRFGRAASFARQAATLALADAGLDVEQLADARVTIPVGTTDGESQDLDELSDRLRDPDARIDPVLAGRVHPVHLAAGIAELVDSTLVDLVTIATACSAGNYAIGYGYDAIVAGEADLALVGGADALCRKTFTGFYRLGTIAPDLCRPFDADRSGILTGEGAGILVLEPLQVAEARGATVLAEVIGYGLTCDASHPVAPDIAGVAACVSKALERSGIRPDEVDLVSAHGTGTKANDVAECTALVRVFGEQPPRTISIKSMIGHSMGAASAIGAIASAQALESGFIPPTINHRTTDDACPIDCVPNESIDAPLRVVQNNGLAFGGNNAVLLLRAAS